MADCLPLVVMLGQIYDRMHTIIRTLKPLKY